MFQRFITFINEKNLSPGEMRKYSNRPEKFLQLYKSGYTFILKDGTPVTLTIDDNIVKILETAIKNNTDIPWETLSFKSINGADHKITQFKKTIEFGGKSSDHCIAKENSALEQLRAQIFKAKNNNPYIILIDNKGKEYKISDVISTPGTPKSDFHLVDQNNKIIFWISHKNGTNEKHFQQWGGITEPIIKDDNEVINFKKDCQILFKGVMPNATTNIRLIDNDNLKAMAIYGYKYGFDYNEQNVNVCIQGNIILEKSKKGYTLKGSHILWNGDIPTDGYEPVLMITYKGVGRNDAKIKGARITISPKNCRKNSGII